MAGQAWDYRDDTLELHGELYRPEGALNGRAVLVVHEADGIGGNVRRRCEALAALGYVAGAADMHGGGRVLDDDQIAPATTRFKADVALIRGRVRAALDALMDVADTAPASTAAIGYCFGGYAVLELARSGADLAGVASFHGLLTSVAPAKARDIRSSIFVANGALDPLVLSEDVAAFEAEMREAGADWHMLNHGRALHSFSNIAVDALGDPRMRYDPVADAISWTAAMAFLDQCFGRQTVSGATR